jgi:hypothetical protein
MKIITEIFGGLGNQMFQYACGKAVAQRLKARLFLDLSWFDNGNRTYLLDIFPNIHYSRLPCRNFISRKVIALSHKVLRRLGIVYTSIINEPYNYFYWSGIEDIKSSVILSGYWQNEKYFFGISSIIRHDFMFPEFDCLESKNIAKRIKETPCSVNIHIRRGDYVENPEINCIHGVCSPDYYEKAIQIITEKSEEKITPELFLFSDDPVWVKNNFNTFGLPAIVIDIQGHKDKSFHDMHLMSLCRHHIIANSSFSWWGAWLSSGNGIVVAPKRWLADETMIDYSPSLESWITI